MLWYSFNRFSKKFSLPASKFDLVSLGGDRNCDLSLSERGERKKSQVGVFNSGHQLQFNWQFAALSDFLEDQARV